MFGYVRPAFSHLPPEEKERYKSAYCGLCHAMGKRHGWLARFTLNYEFTLLAILHSGIGADHSTGCLHCLFHPFRKAQVCLCGSSLDTAADQSMILTWYKLSDDVADHGFWGGLPARLLRRLLQRGYRRAVAAMPEFDRNVKLQTDRLSALERANSPQLDRAADTFASILAYGSLNLAEDAAKHRPMEQILYHLGRWVYLIDAWDDLSADIKKGRYNPLNTRFDGNAASERSYIETTMTHSLHLIQVAANLLDLGVWQPITDNVFYVGLPAIQKAVLDGTWKELRKKQGRHKYERPL